MDESSSDLKRFREQWREEVSARLQQENNLGLSLTSSGTECQYGSLIDHFLCTKSTKNGEKGKDRVEPFSHSQSDDISCKEILVQNYHSDRDVTLATALDHYEQAVKKEDEGNLGDSLDLYRKAFHINDRVDQEYKKKHFEQAPTSTVVNIRPTRNTKLGGSSDQHDSHSTFPNLKNLIGSFSGLSIEADTSDSQGALLPCPLAKLPDEILIHVFTVLALSDVASLAKVAQVCKKMAYIVITEQQIWKRICVGSEFGFGAMHYEWSRDALRSLFDRQDINERSLTQESKLLNLDDVTKVLLHKNYSSSWYEMFRQRPRIRFSGCYISTVNYLRPGEASPSQVSWNSPILIVTYYRYLRFFRDGTVISLLTTHEPPEIVPLITKSYLDIHRNSGASHLPSKFMQKALRGRWHLSRYHSNPNAKSDHHSNSDDSKNDESDVYIETEGANEKYIYQMNLSLRSSTAGNRRKCTNNKLIWRSFRSFNRLTNELGEFSLKEEKAFYWSRVKSYGNG